MTVEDATARQTVLFFGPGGQLAQVRDGEGNVISLGYDGNFQLTGLTGGGGQRYLYSYDSQGNVIGMEDPVRNHTDFEYSSTFNNLTSITDARDNGIQYDYDAAGNLTSIIYENGTIESFTYDAAGNALTWTNRRGDTVTYTYNLAGQLTSKDYPDTPGLIDYEYLYDDAGNLVSSTDPNGTTTMAYDPDTDWLTRIDYPGGQLFTFDYDDAGRRTLRTDQDGNVLNYIYDTLGRLDRMTDGTDALIVDYDYDAAGRMELKSMGNGVYTTYEYDQAEQLTHLVNHRPDDSILSRFDYTYDASGRRTSMTTLDGTHTYGYDPLGQLTSVAYPDGRLVNYVYDAAGNRIEVVDDGASTAYVTNEMNQYTDVGGVIYTHDGDGNTVSKTEDGVTTTYTYNIENRLIGVSTPTDTWTYTYDALGNRVASTHNGTPTNYVVDPIGLGDVAAEYDDVGNLIASYEHGFGLLTRTNGSGASAYYSFDAIGSTSELTSDGGSVLNSYTYDPLGISLSQSETVSNPFEYVGEYGVMHEANGLEFMRARYYIPYTGRFTSADPIGILGGVNLYAYAFNSPVSYSDPRGLQGSGSGGTGAIGSPHFSKAEQRSREADAQRQQQAIEDSKKQRKAIDDAIERARNQPMGRNFPGGQQRGPDYGKPEKTPDIDDEAFDPGGTGKGDTVGSYDPNDKLGPAGYGADHFTSVNSVLPYQIRFENKAEATAPARKIVVTDTLHDDLDLSTLVLTEIAFAEHTILIPAGLDHYETTVPISPGGHDLLVQIDAALDLDTRQLTLTMLAVDPATGWLPQDPLLGLLYPNDDTGRGDGHISYLVHPKADLPSGTEITNRATIVFDWNDPIDTPLVLNTIDAAAPESNVLSLPASTAETTFEVQWSGQDEPGGSGIANYDIYVSVDDGPYGLLQDDTTSTSTTFTGELGHTYAFYSIATDNVGHREAPPELPDVTISIIPPLQIEAGPGQSAVEGALVDLSEAYYVYPGDSADLSLTIDWGDGTIEPGILVPGVGGGMIANTHDYADNAPEPYVITLTLSDNAGTTVEDSLQVNVSNAPPIIAPTPDQETDEGASLDLSVSFSDPGTADTHTAVIDWGDGTVDGGIVDQAAGTVLGSHVYGDNGVYTVSVTVTDDEGAEASDTLAVTVLNVDPTVAPLLPEETEENEEVTLEATAIDPGSDDLTFTWDWGDGTVDTVTVYYNDGLGPDPYPSPQINPTDVTDAVSHTYGDNGVYTVTLTVEDDDGMSTAVETTVTVLNVAPTITGLSATPETIDENGTVTFSGTFIDPGTQDTFTLVVDWGEGEPETVNLEAGVRAFTLPHQYLDDNPTGTPSDMYTINLTLTDDDSGQDTGQITTVVDNVDPVVDPIVGSIQGVRGQPLSYVGTFSDVGTLDTYTLEWTVTYAWCPQLCGDRMCDYFGKPLELTFQYTGGGEDATNTHQPEGKYSVSGDPNEAATVHILASSKGKLKDVDPSNTFFDGVVNLGDEFTLDVDNAGKDKFGSKTFIYILDPDDNLLQTVEYHTSCSAPIVLGDVIGGVTLSGYVGETGSATLNGDCTITACLDPCQTNVCDQFGKPLELTFQYTGGGEDVTDTHQPEGKYSVSGDPNEAATVHILASSKGKLKDVDPSNTFFDGVVNLGDEFTLDVDNAGKDKFGSKTFIYILDPDDNLLQTVEYHTSCSAPIVLGDVIGGVTLTEYVGEGGMATLPEDPTIFASGSGPNFTFVPTQLGVYTVTFTVTDDDTGQDSTSLDVAIGRTYVEDGVLYIGGTNCRDHIDVKKGKEPGTVEVKIDEKDTKIKTRGTFGPTIDKVVVYAQGGDDKVHVHNNTELVATELYGGPGDDKLKSGRSDDLLDGGPGDDDLKADDGNDVLIGGDGDDKLNGGKGMDLLIGGLGADDIKGGSDGGTDGGGDILIAGLTRYDNNVSALRSILDQWISDWNTGQPYDQIVDDLVAAWLTPGEDVFEDGVTDKLDASNKARDLFFADLDEMDEDDDKVKGDKNDRVIELGQLLSP